MRSAIWSGFLAAIVCAVTVGLVAQQPPSSPASQAGKTVTFSGCIEKAPAEAGASAATATPAFILANAAPAGSASSSPSGTVGTSGGAKPAAKYRLDADAAKLTPHVGHKVEITGTVDEMSSSATPSTPPSGATASSPSAPAPKLKVDSVKMVAATCP